MRDRRLRVFRHPDGRLALVDVHGIECDLEEIRYGSKPGWRLTDDGAECVEVTMLVPVMPAPGYAKGGVVPRHVFRERCAHDYAASVTQDADSQDKKDPPQIDVHVVNVSDPEELAKRISNHDDAIVDAINRNRRGVKKLLADPVDVVDCEGVTKANGDELTDGEKKEFVEDLSRAIIKPLVRRAIRKAILEEPVGACPSCGAQRPKEEHDDACPTKVGLDQARAALDEKKSEAPTCEECKGSGVWTIPANGAESPCSRGCKP